MLTMLNNGFIGNTLAIENRLTRRLSHLITAFGIVLRKKLLDANPFFIYNLEGKAIT